MKFKFWVFYYFNSFLQDIFNIFINFYDQGSHTHTNSPFISCPEAPSPPLHLWTLSHSPGSLSNLSLADHTHADPQSLDPSLPQSLRPSFSSPSFFISLSVHPSPSVSRSFSGSPPPHLFSATPPSTFLLPFSPPGGGEHHQARGGLV